MYILRIDITNASDGRIADEGQRPRRIGRPRCYLGVGTIGDLRIETGISEEKRPFPPLFFALRNRIFGSQTMNNAVSSKSYVNTETRS